MIVGNLTRKLPAFAQPPDQFLSTARFRSADLVNSQMIDAGISMPVARWRSALGRDAVTKGYSHHSVILQNSGEDVRRIDSPAFLNRRSKAGSLLFLRAGMNAAWRSDEISDRTHFYVHPDLLTLVSHELLGTDCALRDDGMFIFDPSLSDLLQQYAFVLESAKSTRFERDLLTLRIAAILVQRHSQQPAHGSDPETKLRTYIEDNLANKLCAQSLCEALAITPFALKKLADQAFGMTLHQYILSRRLDRAAAALKRGVPIVQAALDAGFSSQAHLTSTMRRKRGTTPSALLLSVS
jgi:AraC family transcriptional regulator